MKKIYLCVSLIFFLFISNLSTVSAAETVDTLKVGITKDENGLNPYTYVTGYPGLEMRSLMPLILGNIFHFNRTFLMGIIVQLKTCVNQFRGYESMLLN